MWIQTNDEKGIMVMIEITDTIRFWLNFINVLDLLINLVGLVNMSMCIRIFYKKPLFHLNLVLLMSSGYALGIVILTCGVIKCIACIWDFRFLAHASTIPQDYFMLTIEGIRAWVVMSGIFALAAIIMERVWATINLHHYEQNNNPCVIAAILILNGCLGFIMFTLCFYFRYYLISIGILSVFTVFSGLAFRFSYSWNERQLQATKSQVTNVYVLSQRYQLTENIRVFNMLQKCKTGFLLCCGIGLIFPGCMLAFTDVSTVRVREYIIREGLHIIVAAACNVLCLCSITGTYVWREMLKAQLNQFIICRAKKRAHQCDDEKTAEERYRLSKVKTTDGVPLAFTVREEADMYFKQLNVLWT